MGLPDADRPPMHDARKHPTKKSMDIEPRSASLPAMVLAAMVLITSACSDRRSQYPVFDPEYAGEVFCECYTREFDKRSTGANWDLCMHETRLHSHYFDLNEDSSSGVGGKFLSPTKVDSSRLYFGRWLKAIKPCRELDGKSRFDTLKSHPIRF